MDDEELNNVGAQETCGRMGIPAFCPPVAASETAGSIRGADAGIVCDSTTPGASLGDQRIILPQGLRCHRSGFSLPSGLEFAALGKEKYGKENQLKKRRP
jgi:hypothetical protein